MAEIKLNCILRDDVAEQFAEIKKLKGLTNNTEIVRLLITEYHKRLVDANGTPVTC